MLDSGWLQADSVPVQAGALLRGWGQITANAVVNSGTLAVGDTTVLTPRTLGIMGSYTQTSTGRLEMDIANPASHDVLDVSGAVAFGGTLQVELLSGFMPYPGVGSGLVRYGSASGTFSTYDLPSLMMGHWVPNYGPSMFYLTVAR